MASSLREVLSKVDIRTKKHGQGENSIFQPFPTDPNRLGNDGVDHINISPYAKTELGKALSNEIALEVHHRVFGKFTSITGFWYYIKSKERDDRCRKLVGKSLKDFSKRLTLSEAKNFRAIILDTVWQKICQYPAIAEELEKSELPFDCYFEDRQNSLRQRPNYFAWFLEGMTELRAAVKEKREPNLDKYLDDQHSDIYDFVKVKRDVPAAKAPGSEIPDGDGIDNQPEQEAV